MRISVSVLCAVAAVAAPVPERLTLAEAEAIALKSHPGVMASNLDALAAREKIDQARSARFPFVTAAFTAVGAGDDNRIAAGGLNNPIIYSRVATGVNVTQTLMDFGRTSKLIDSTKAASAAFEQRAEATRADILLAVRTAYFGVLRAEKVVSVAKATAEARQVVVDHISELVKAQLKSSLDQSFAETSLAEAKLLVSTAENQRQAAYVQLSNSLGTQNGGPYELAEEPRPNVEPLALSELREQALNRRPELKALRLEREAARDTALAERAARFPTIALGMGAGYVPNAGSRLSSDYLAGGVNISLPFLNGGLYKARQAEAELRARAADSRVEELSNRIVRDVSTAWLDVNTAFERIRLTEQFVQQAAQALELAQTRYDLGLGSMVELSQAELTRTNAQIQNVTAVYDYQLRRSILERETGGL